MYRRLSAAIALSLLIVATASTSAFGWVNGGDDGNGYGTHDWLLEHAIALAGEDGSWIDVETALKASDDPDSMETSRYLHVYKETGRGRGGPQQVANVYNVLMNAYEDGDYIEASRLLGVMSHYYTDICQPYHTAIKGASATNPRHTKYEKDQVGPRTNSYSESASWRVPRSRKSATDVRAKAVSSALYARSKYASLDSAFKSSGKVTMTNTSGKITGLVLSRTMNDLADIICEIPDGRGRAKAPTTMKQKMMKKTYQYPRKGTNFSADKICSEVWCYDADGKPMPGVAITFTWPFGSGPKSYLTYTDNTGYARNWQVPGTGIPLMKKRTLTASATLSGVTKTSSTWYMPTPVLASKTAGVLTKVSNNRPAQGSTVKASTRFRDKNGKAVVGLPVTFKWYFKGKTITEKTVTNSKGYASSSRNIGKAAKGYRVYVKGEAYSGRYRRYSRASFIPH